MSDWQHVLAIVTSILLMAGGAHVAVESSCRIGRRLGVSQLVIGLTFVALGTSLPELTVTLVAAFEGQGGISVGNVVGSNVFNLGFILGGCALVSAIPTSRTLMVRDGFILLLAATFLTLMLYWDLTLGRFEGGVMLLGLIAYIFFLYWTGARHASEAEWVSEAVGDDAAKQSGSLMKDLLVFSVGLAVVIGASQLLVHSATHIARVMGVTEWVIGVTVVAAGTSAPELAVSVVSLMKGRFDISAGNLIGSDLFNILGVLGVAGLVHPVTVSAQTRPSLILVPASVLLLLVFVRTGWRISRLEGGLLFLVGALRWWVDIQPM